MIGQSVIPPDRNESRQACTGIPGAATERGPAIPPRKHSIHPRPDSRQASHTPPDANGIRLQSNRSGIISSIALRAFKAFLPFAVVL